MTATTPAVRSVRDQKPAPWGKLISRFLVYLVLTLGLSFTLLPFLMMILSSFKTNLEVLQVPPTFWPQNPTLENYVKIINDPKLPLLRFYGNSAFVAFFNVSIDVVHQLADWLHVCQIRVSRQENPLRLVPDDDDDPRADHYDSQLPDSVQTASDQLAVGIDHFQRSGCIRHLHDAPVLRDAAKRIV